MSDNARLAVLIDADNAQAALTSQMLGELAKYGTLTVKRAYGDWTNQRMVSWKKQLNEHAIQPVQQFAYTTGKNATDSALIIDAMDLLYSGTLDGFCLVSSDSDFTRLATRLREAGKTVYGLGQRKTPGAFIAACDKFVFAEVLDGGGGGRGKGGGKGSQADQSTQSAQSDQGASGGSGGGKAKKESGRRQQPPKAAPEPEEPAVEEDDRTDDAPTEVPPIERILPPAIEGTAKDSGWASLGSVGSYLNKAHASFDPRNYGYPRLSVLVGDLDWVDVKEVPDANDFPQIWVRVARDPS